MIESLDASCGPALHSKRHDLRRHSLPFDWVQSPSLSEVYRNMKNLAATSLEIHCSNPTTTLFFEDIYCKTKTAE
nr:DUF1796 family putative cysteine peptidase [Peribacillus muralis]